MYGRKQRTRRLAWVLVSMLVVFMLTACGAKPADTAPEQTAPEQTTPEQTQPEQVTPEPAEIRLEDVGIALDQVKAITVSVNPPGTTIELGESEQGKTLELMRNVVIQEQDDSYTEYDGQCVQYTLVMQSGETHIVSFFNPFVVVDDTGYRADCDACTGLSEIGSDIASRENEG